MTLSFQLYQQESISHNHQERKSWPQADTDRRNLVLAKQGRRRPSPHKQECAKRTLCIMVEVITPFTQDHHNWVLLYMHGACSHNRLHLTATAFQIRRMRILRCNSLGPRICGYSKLKPICKNWSLLICRDNSLLQSYLHNPRNGFINV